jgi:hypothetical protein
LSNRSRADARRGAGVIELWSRHGRRAGLAGDGVSGSEDEVVGTGVRRAGDLARSMAAHRRRTDGGDGGGGARDARADGLLTDDEVRALESTYPEGMTAVQVVEVFTSRGVKFSEASFRKYVQQGLLPRSRRVGRKGKHRGSLGVYPAKTIRRINAVKQLMNDGHTIEEIQAEFLQFTDLVETVGEGLTELFARLEQALEASRADAQAHRGLARELGDARRVSEDLARRLDELARRVAAPAANRIRRTGAAGSAEDLL